ncbi:MAG: PilT protein domain protein [Caulobacteraceae bacterium]|nr:PilT protein domain protein [Caulobacteraceae bacterium]
MTVRVIDASAVAAVLFGEGEADLVLERLEGCALIAPGLLSHELSNVCLKKCRRSAQDRELLVAGLAQLNDLDIELMTVDPVATLKLALETGLSAYDASYLWLARHLGVELITLDRRLAVAFAAG